MRSSGWSLENLNRINSDLTDVPETMLWTLHNRSSEAEFSDSILEDRKGLEIYKSINYDYERSFGKADGFHAIRAREFDLEINQWLKMNPFGTIVSLGEGLETQKYRVDNGTLNWITLDLPEAIKIREKFIQTDSRSFHISKSVLDFSWIKDVKQIAPNHRDVFFVVQGLFMYLSESQVQMILTEIGKNFPNFEMMFDTSPVWMSKMTKRGWYKTPTYKVPLMPWGIDKNEIIPKLKEWLPTITESKFYDYIYPRGKMKFLTKCVLHTPFIRNCVPVMVKISTSSDFC